MTDQAPDEQLEATEADAAQMVTVPAWAVTPAEAPAFRENLTSGTIYAQLIKAQGEFGNLVADVEGQAGTRPTKYVDLGKIMAMLRPVLAKHELGLMQSLVDTGADERTIVTRLIHTGGEWIEVRMAMPVPRGATPQDIGSAVTYGRRYSISSLFALATEKDDDGHAGSERSRQSNEAPPDAEETDEERAAKLAAYFADPTRVTEAGEPLVTQEHFDAISATVHTITAEQRAELTAWRQAENIVVTPAKLTDADAVRVLDKLAEYVPVVEDLGELADAVPDEGEAPATLDLEGDDSGASTTETGTVAPPEGDSAPPLPPKRRGRQAASQGEGDTTADEPPAAGDAVPAEDPAAVDVADSGYAAE